MSNPIKDILNKYLSPEGKAELKSHLEKFAAAPATTTTTTPTNTTPPATGQQGTLQDGTVVKWDTPTLAVGSSVTVVTDSGELPIPDGEYVMQDGTNITTVNGKVTEIESAATESTEPEGMATPTDPNAPANGTDENPNTEKRLQALEAAVAKMMSMMGQMAPVAQAQAQFKTDLDAVKEDVTKVAQAFNALLDVPTGTVIEQPVKNTKLESKLNNISQILKTK